MGIYVNGNENSVIEDNFDINLPEDSWDTARLCEYKESWDGTVSVDVDSVRLWKNTNALDSTEKRVQWAKDLMFGM